MPDIILRTTLIVGFPGESQGEFEELVEFVKWARFDALGAFTYFSEAGTPAAEFPDQVPGEIKQARLEALMLAQQEIAFARNEERVGSRLTCLVEDGGQEAPGKGRRRQAANGRGRFYGQAPDIDSLCLIRGCSAAPGRFVETRVVGTRDYDLVVEQI